MHGDGLLDLDGPFCVLGGICLPGCLCAFMHELPELRSRHDQRAAALEDARLVRIVCDAALDIEAMRADVAGELQALDRREREHLLLQVVVEELVELFA